MSLLNLVVKIYFLPASKSEFINNSDRKGKQVSLLSKTLFYFHGYMAELTDENILLKFKALCKFFGSRRISGVNKFLSSFVT